MKFWEIPELVEKLVALLDPLSTTCLAQSGVMETDIFQKSMSSKVWKNFIRQSSSVSVDRGVLLREDVKRLVAVLNLMKVEDPTNFLVALLDLVSAQFPSCQGESFPFERNGRVDVTSPHRTEPLTTSLWGFLLLEDAQLHPQMIEAVCISLPALAKTILDAVEEGFVVFKTDQHLQDVDTVRGLPASVNVSDWEKMKEIMYMTEDEFNDELQEEKSRLERIDWGEGGWTMVFEEVEETEDGAVDGDSD